MKCVLSFAINFSSIPFLGPRFIYICEVLIVMCVHAYTYTA